MADPTFVSIAIGYVPLLLCLPGQLSSDSSRSVILLISLALKSVSTTVRLSLEQNFSVPVLFKTSAIFATKTVLPL